MDLNINPVSTNKTQPLPYERYVNNKIYEFYPLDRENESESFRSSPRSVKRAKSANFYKELISPKQRGTSNNITSLKRRMKSCLFPSSSTMHSRVPSRFSLEEREFSFDSHSVPSSTNNSDVSDLESLPDLTEDEYTPTNTPIKEVPMSLRNTLIYDLEDYKPRVLFPKQEVQDQLQTSRTSIFDIPELVYRIIEFVDIQNSVIPQEPTPIRRKPLSYNHALLIHGNKELADFHMKQNTLYDDSQNSSQNSLCDESGHNANSKGSLHSCLLVNKLFYQVTKEIMTKKIMFDDSKKYSQFVESLQQSNYTYKPEVFVLHKLYHTKQSSFESIKDYMNFDNLQWLEIFMCPKLLPPVEFFQRGGKNLRKLILTGSKVVDDDFLIMISENCPNLEVLDIRACESVSDIGIYSIGNKCRNLHTVNFGRKQKGHLITDTSLSKLISNNRNLSTVGLAGCNITDKVVWELALRCSHSLQRLSLNNCPLISNQSIPIILASVNTNSTTNHIEQVYFKNLSVLELRNNYQITSWQSIIEFKRRQEYRGITLLLELCETLMLRMRQEELEMDKTISQRIFRDILDWVNDNNDGDNPYDHLLTRNNNRN
ncbi:antagonist of mitotic exit network protein 1 [Scheffersomyces amazonensis]|uniref:antagonist of mitotic exit network protein 1 n=1 Tax=Scheffersomyces amazonensis TaxID=1078765 RepID=UPI00315C56AF